jgi:hypothetical protein
MAEIKGETLPVTDNRELIKGVPNDDKDWYIVAFFQA